MCKLILRSRFKLSRVCCSSLSTLHFKYVPARIQELPELQSSCTKLFYRKRAFNLSSALKILLRSMSYIIMLSLPVLWCSFYR